jgi:hypothetical protein
MVAGSEFAPPLPLIFYLLLMTCRNGRRDVSSLRCRHAATLPHTFVR